MNIKELAEQAGASVEADTIIVNGKDADDFVKRFAELVRQDERNRQRTKKEWSDHDRAIAAAEREQCAKDFCDSMEESKRNERYIKEMEQPVPKQSGVMSITVSKVCEADALPPTDNAIYWMDMVVGNLVRNGVNKHRARELAHHFYTYTTPRENGNG